MGSKREARGDAAHLARADLVEGLGAPHVGLVTVPEPAVAAVAPRVHDALARHRCAVLLATGRVHHPTTLESALQATKGAGGGEGPARIWVSLTSKAASGLFAVQISQFRWWLPTTRFGVDSAM